jgi:hypothetical protein
VRVPGFPSRLIAAALFLASLPVAAGAAQQQQGGGAATAVMPKQSANAAPIARPGSASADHQRIAQAACKYSYPQATPQQMKECVRNYIAANWGGGTLQPATPAPQRVAPGKRAPAQQATPIQPAPTPPAAE